MSDPERNISPRLAAAQARRTPADENQRRHKSNTADLNDRVFVYAGTLVVVGLLVLWLVAPSALVIYGSLATIVLLTIVWGVVRIRRIDRIRKQRELQARGDLMQ